MASSSSSLFSPSPSPGPSSSSRSSSTNQLPESTIAHLISLPQLLHPLSPALAALHMARLRLALSIPNRPDSAVSRSNRQRGNGKGKGKVASGDEGWCHLCGGLRIGMGGAERRAIATNTTKIKGQAQSEARQPGSGGRAGSGLELGVGVGSESGSVKTGPKGKKGKNGKREKTTFRNEEYDQDVIRERESTTKFKPKLKRKSPECETCGASFKRPKPDLSTLNDFPPARRMRRATRNDIDNNNNNHGDVSVPVSQSQLSTRKPDYSISGSGSSPGFVSTRTHGDQQKQSEQYQDPLTLTPLASGTNKQNIEDDGPANLIANMDRQVQAQTRTLQLQLQIQDSIPSASPVETTSLSTSTPLTPAPAPEPKPLLSRPSLSHISSSEPNLPTYPNPAPSIPLSPQPQSQPQSQSRSTGKTSTSVSTSAGAGAGSGVKRKKKSGLAKLLAENKERQQAGASQGGGLWGLG
ncbi:hypothetical protein IAT40_007776 [Kwoniella sp. CBS 6097]